MQIMLGGTVLALPDSLRGPLEDFSKKTTGNEGAEWEEAFKKFLRKEPYWMNGDEKSAAPAEPQQEFAPPPMSITINGDANPSVPSRLYLEGQGTEHRQMDQITLEKREDGKLYVNGVEATLYLSPKQMNGKMIEGRKLRKELKGKKVLNACIFDALRANPHLIPNDWKRDEQGRTRHIFF